MSPNSTGCPDNAKHSLDVRLKSGAASRKLVDEVDDSGSLPLSTVDRQSKLVRKAKRSKWIWFVLFIGIVAAASFASRERLLVWLARSSVHPDSGVELPEIEKVVSLGRLEPEGEVIFVGGPSGSSDARVQSLLVDVGDYVEAGQILATLDNGEQLQTQLLVAQSQVEQACMRLKQTRLVVSTTYAQLQANLEALRSQRETARSELRRQEQLRITQASSEQEFEATELAYITTDKAVAEVSAKLARYSHSVDDSVDVQVAQADVVVAEATLQNAKTQLERSLVRAPIKGRVLAIDLRPGERISQQSLLRIGRTDSMYVRAEVYESDIAKIHTGQSALIRSINFSTPLRGIVESVAVLVQRQSIVDSDPAANTDARVIDVLVEILPDSIEKASRFVGMQVIVEFPI